MEKKEILTKNELKELFKKAKEGNLEAKEEIIIHNLGLINMIINNRFAYVDCEREDLVSYGILGLLKAINSFDIEKK